MNRLKKFLLNDVFYLMICFSLFFLIEKHVIPLEKTDDLVFSTQLKEMGAFSWIVQFYMNWSGRVVLTFLDAVLLNLPVMIWRILNASVFSLMLLMITKITEAKWMRYALLVMIFCIPTVTLSSSSLWITGSLNYLWPAGFMMVVLYYLKLVFKGKEINLEIFCFAFVSMLFACGMEQTALIVVVMTGITLIYEKLTYGSNDKKNVALLLFAFMNTIFLFSAPGNYVRSASELLQWNPSFDMLSILDKCFYGLFASVRFLMQDMSRTITVLSLLLFLIKPLSILSVLPVAYFFLLRDYYSELTQTYLLIQEYNPLYQTESFMWIPFLIAFLVFVMIVANIISLMESEHEKLWIFLIMFAGVCSTTILGFSPTLTGSGERIYFVMSVFIFYAIIEVLSKSKYEGVFTMLCCGMFCSPFISNITLFMRDYAYLFFF